MIKDATTFFAMYYYDAYYKEGQNKFNILIIGSKHIAGYTINQFVSKTDEKEEKMLNYAYDAYDLKDLKNILSDITSRIKKPKHKFILTTEDEIDMDKMSDILENWKKDIIIINKENYDNL